MILDLGVGGDTRLNESSSLFGANLAVLGLESVVDESGMQVSGQWPGS